MQNLEVHAECGAGMGGHSDIGALVLRQLGHYEVEWPENTCSKTASLSSTLSAMQCHLFVQGTHDKLLVRSVSYLGFSPGPCEP